MENRDKILLELKETFYLVTDWLKFAEAKNGAILALIGGIIYTFNSFDSELNIYIYFLLYLLLILSFLSSILSFYPNIGTTVILNKISKCFFYLANFPNKNQNNQIDNNLREIKSFYGDIGTNYEINNYEEYLTNIAKDYYNIDLTSFSTLEKEYAKEIIILSKITISKFIFFKFTIKCILLFTFIFIFSITCNKIFEKDYYIVIGKNAIVREYPDINSLELFKLKKSISVMKIDSKKNWIKIKTDKKLGWVHKSLLEKK